MNKRRTGTKYEDIACDFLKEQGIEILERNFRSRFGEIDIVAKEGETLLFIEVKYRSGRGSGAPEEAVTPRKMKTIRFVSLHYLMKHECSEDVPVRYDVVAIEGSEIRYIKNAF